MTVGERLVTGVKKYKSSLFVMLSIESTGMRRKCARKMMW